MTDGLSTTVDDRSAGSDLTFILPSGRVTSTFADKSHFGGSSSLARSGSSPTFCWIREER